MCALSLSHVLAEPLSKVGTYSHTTKHLKKCIWSAKMREMIERRTSVPNLKQDQDRL